MTELCKMLFSLLAIIASTSAWPVDDAISKSSKDDSSRALSAGASSSAIAQVGLGPKLPSLQNPDPFAQHLQNLHKQPHILVNGLTGQTQPILPDQPFNGYPYPTIVRPNPVPQVAKTYPELFNSAPQVTNPYPELPNSAPQVTIPYPALPNTVPQVAIPYPALPNTVPQVVSPYPVLPLTLNSYPFPFPV